MTAALQRSVARYFGGLSQIILDFFSEKNIRKYYYDLLQESTWLRAFYYNDNMNFYVLIFKTFPFLKIFVTLVVQTNWCTCGEWMGNFGFILRVCDKQCVLQHGKII